MHCHKLDKNPRWKGGISKVINYCLDCGIQTSSYRAKRCRHCASGHHLKGKKLSLEHVSKIKESFSSRINPMHIPEIREKQVLASLLRHGHKDRSIPAMNQLFRTYKDSAKFRGYIFDLSTEQFKIITSSNCFYCGDKPKQRRRNGRLNSKYPSFYTFNGIDRVDNSMGYVETNCVPCCKLCNKMKRANTAKEFLEHVVKIAKNMEVFSENLGHK